jgi:hypothetical protein
MCCLKMFSAKGIQDAYFFMWHVKTVHSMSKPTQFTKFSVNF